MVRCTWDRMAIQVAEQTAHPTAVRAGDRVFSSTALRTNRSAGGTKMVAIASGSTDRMKALVQDGSGSADVLHLREIGAPAVTDDRVLVKGTQPR